MRPVKNMMFVQKLALLAVDNVEELKELIETKIRPLKFALVVHDKDINEDGDKIEPHVHLMMSFKNARHISSIAKKLSDKPNNIQKWEGNSAVGYCYLIHLNDEDKFQYNPDTVIANFDYKTLIFKHSKKIESNKIDTPDIKFMLDCLYEGKITVNEICNSLKGSVYAKCYRQIKEVHSKFLERNARNYREKMVKEGIEVTVIWLYGDSGSGKTSFSIDYAKNREYYISGSSRDPFQNYQGQHVIVLDDLRPNTMYYSDLLKILNSYTNQECAPSRYNDKFIAADLIMITTPYSPDEFYFELIKKSRVEKVDSFNQLKRRINLCLFLDQDNIYKCDYDENNRKYVKTNHRKYNKFSEKSRCKKDKSIEIFKNMFEEGK